MYAAVLIWIVAIWIFKEWRPTTRVPDTVVVVGPICIGLMMASIHYLRSKHGAQTLARFYALDVKMKILLGVISSAFYGGIFLRVAELGSRTAN